MEVLLEFQQRVLCYHPQYYTMVIVEAMDYGKIQQVLFNQEEAKS
jgi:hypothetical protein